MNIIYEIYIFIYISVNLEVTIRRFHTLMSVGRKKLLVCEKNVAAFSCCEKKVYKKVVLDCAKSLTVFKM